MFESATPRRTSRDFRCALFGVGMTILARLGPWDWPGWPARTLLDFALERAAPSVVTPSVKALGLIVLLVVNAGFWGLAAWIALAASDRVRKR